MSCHDSSWPVRNDGSSRQNFCKDKSDREACNNRPDCSRFDVAHPTRHGPHDGRPHPAPSVYGAGTTGRGYIDRQWRKSSTRTTNNGKPLFKKLYSALGRPEFHTHPCLRPSTPRRFKSLDTFQESVVLKWSCSLTSTELKCVLYFASYCL